MLENDEIEELRLGDEAVLCENAGMRFIHFPVGDRGTPASIAAVSKLVSGLATELRGGRAVGIYCRMGIGRSASLAVCVLAALGMVLEDAWAAMERARHLSVPDTLAQKEWVAAWCATFDFPRPDA
ncbi:MAG: hypothetical protein JWM57_850 [Phycisphaerales bacterium]|nr:hypothetical protein [Phycisphaerales bacterium]